GQRTSVLEFCANGLYVGGQSADVAWCRAIGGRVVAKLPAAIRAPTLDGAACDQRTVVVRSGDDGLYVTQPADVHRCRVIGGRTIAQLAAAVRAPAFDGAARHQRTGVVPSGGNGAHAGT